MAQELGQMTHNQELVNTIPTSVCCYEFDSSVLKPLIILKVFLITMWFWPGRILQQLAVVQVGNKLNTDLSLVSHAKGTKRQMCLY